MEGRKPLAEVIGLRISKAKPPRPRAAGGDSREDREDERPEPSHDQDEFAAAVGDLFDAIRDDNREAGEAALKAAIKACTANSSDSDRY
jgi:hypothetical protein